jgi:tetratricopeptide (TPR) repeat protein
MHERRAGAARSSSLHAGLRMLAVALFVTPCFALTVDIASLWNFDDPAGSEQRFQALLAHSEGDDALILQTQIARTYGLRRQFARAQSILHAVDAELPEAGPEARTRYWLELGRTYSSATHPPESQTSAARQHARTAYLRAYEYARFNRLDALAVDALHMLAFVDTAPTDQLRWGELALDAALSSPQPAARAWEASLRNNVGYALLELNRNDEALAQFQRALALREKAGNAETTWIARWMVARTLRAQGRIDEALDIQHRIERERDEAHAPDPDVFEELALLYREKGDAAHAAAYASRANHPAK